MKYNPSIHHRQSIRLDNYDYSQQGAYFVTICTYGRFEVFGDIVESKVHLSEQGRIAHAIWHSLPQRFPGIELDAFVVMPNHVHGVLLRSQLLASAPKTNKTTINFKYQYKNFRIADNRNQTLNEMMRTFKAATSYKIHKNGNPEFTWQRGFYEHIIRNAEEFNFIHSYIANNPAKWQEDTLHATYIPSPRTINIPGIDKL